MLCLKIEVLLLGFEAIETWKGFSQAFLAFQSFFVASRVGNEGRRQKILGLASGNTSFVSAKASCHCCRIQALTLEADELHCTACVSFPARPTEAWPWTALLAMTLCVPSRSQPWHWPPCVSLHSAVVPATPCVPSCSLFEGTSELTLWGWVEFTGPRAEVGVSRRS